MKTNALAILAIASCVTAACRTTSPPPPALPASLLACGKIADPLARVQCYDTQIAAITSPAPVTPAPSALVQTPPAVAPAPPAPAAPAAAAVAPAPAVAPSATPASPGAQFGQETLPLRSRPPASAQEAVLVSNITDVLEVRHELFIITLANGQVWRQEGEGAQITRFFHAGDEVRIEKGVLGSYHMSTAAVGSKNWVAVTRIR